LNKLIKYDLVRGLKDVTFEKDRLCSACQARKQVGNKHPKKSMISTSKAFECYTWIYLGQPHTLALVETNIDL
jgi:positive regulator of sigma E activity